MEHIDIFLWLHISTLTVAVPPLVPPAGPPLVPPAGAGGRELSSALSAAASGISKGSEVAGGAAAAAEGASFAPGTLDWVGCRGSTLGRVTRGACMGSYSSGATTGAVGMAVLAAGGGFHD